MARDFYEILGVDKDVDDRTLKKAYRTLAMKYHPDRNPDDPEAEEKFKEAAEAYEVLSDKEKRNLYDRFGHEGVNMGGGGRGGFHNAEDVFSQFGDIFGDLFGFGGGGRRKRGPQPGADLRYDMNLSFDEAVFGTTKTIQVPRHRPCDTCEGSGAAEGSKPVTCGTCQGRGQVQHAQGFFTMSSTCPQCKGQGKTISDPCKDCRGSGLTKEEREVEVTIPAGVGDGMRLRLRDEGEAGEKGAPRGDLYVFIHAKESDIFQRDGADIHFVAKLNYVHAVLGVKLTVPTLGEPTEIKVPAGTQHGDRKTIRNEGIQRVNRKDRGDLIVHFIIDVPKKMGRKEKKALEKYADVAGISLKKISMADK